jgi:hypothetical protein
MSNLLNWQEGEEGKGIVDSQGHVHTWNEDDYAVHRDYLDANQHLGRPLSYFYIFPDGTTEITFPSKRYDGRQAHDTMMGRITDADPHLHEGGGTWNFTMPHLLRPKNPPKLQMLDPRPAPKEVFEPGPPKIELSDEEKASIERQKAARRPRKRASK